MRIKLEFTKKRKEINFDELDNEYEIDNSIFSEQSPQFIKLMNVINTELTPIERKILLVYSECKNQKKLGLMLGVSTSTVNKELMIIRNKIKNAL